MIANDWGARGMKTAIYTRRDGSTLEVLYDPHAPCRLCGKPVIEASMGGTNVCPWCDTGNPGPSALDAEGRGQEANQ